MGAGHDHGHGTSDQPVTVDYRRRLTIAFGLTAAIVIAQLIGSVLTGSLALLTDTAHAVTDASGLLVALVAATLMRRPSSKTRTWGFRRIEIIAALAQATLLVAVGSYAAVEGVRRLIDPPEVASAELLFFGVVGFTINVIAIVVLARWVSVGAVVATVIWLVASIGFSIYVSTFGNYAKTYGVFAGIIVLLLWLWLTSYAILLGAEINAEAEQQTGRDTTRGQEEPMGSLDSPPSSSGSTRPRPPVLHQPAIAPVEPTPVPASLQEDTATPGAASVAMPVADQTLPGDPDLPGSPVRGDVAR